MGIRTDKSGIVFPHSAEGVTQSCLFVLFDLILYVPSTIFQLNRDGSSWVEPVLSYDECVLLKDYSTVTPMRLEPASPLSGVKQSTTDNCAPYCLFGKH